VGTVVNSENFVVNIVNKKNKFVENNKKKFEEIFVVVVVVVVDNMKVVKEVVVMEDFELELMVEVEGKVNKKKKRKL